MGQLGFFSKNNVDKFFIIDTKNRQTLEQTCDRISLNSRNGERNMKQRAQLPKNIKQVGQKDGVFRIYLEDYVNTFINKIRESEEESNIPKIGILLGSCETIKEQECWFVDGAIEIEGLWNGNGTFQFSASKWKEIEEKRKRYFPESSMCGWFIHGAEDAKLDFIALKQTHRELFANKNSLFFLCRGEEKNFWVGSGSDLSASQGYYIFFEQNQSMQEYMVETRQGNREIAVEDTAIKNFRTIMEEKKQGTTKTNLKQWYSLLAGAAVLLVACGIGISQSASNPVKKNDTTPVDANSSIQVSWEAVEKEDQKESSSYVAGNETIKSSEKVGSEEVSLEKDSSQQASNQVVNSKVESSENNAKKESDKQEEEVVGQVSKLKEYVIQPGDTLLYISIDHYGSAEMVKPICLLNGITDPNQLYIGQTIKLP